MLLAGQIVLLMGAQIVQSAAQRNRSRRVAGPQLATENDEISSHTFVQPARASLTVTRALGLQVGLHLLGLCRISKFVAHAGLPGQLALISTRRGDGMSADLVTQHTPSHRLFGIIPGDGDRPYIKEIIRS